jgi:hypothetical protein
MNTSSNNTFDMFGLATELRLSIYNEVAVPVRTPLMGPGGAVYIDMVEINILRSCHLVQSEARGIFTRSIAANHPVVTLKLSPADENSWIKLYETLSLVNAMKSEFNRNTDKSYPFLTSYTRLLVKVASSGTEAEVYARMCQVVQFYEQSKSQLEDGKAMDVRIVLTAGTLPSRLCREHWKMFLKAMDPSYNPTTRGFRTRLVFVVPPGHARKSQRQLTRLHDRIAPWLARAGFGVEESMKARA